MGVNLIKYLYIVAGFGSVLMFLVSTCVSINNFSRRHRGLVVGASGAFFLLGPTLFSLAYATGFSDLPDIYGQ